MPFLERGVGEIILWSLKNGFPHNNLLKGVYFMPDMPVRLIATDIDGTLLNERGELTERTRRAIRRAREKGIVVAIATGRFPENAYLLLEDYGLRLPIIGINGARIVDENLNLLSERVMAPESARRVLDALTAIGSDFFIFADHAISAGTKEGVHHSELSQGDRVRALGFRYYHGKEEAYSVLERDVYKFFVRDNQPLDRVREALGGIPGIALTQSYYNNIEVMPDGIDKGKGVAELARLLGITMDQVMTLGDESNDIPMLRAAGYGVAMGNGSEEAKRAARFVTDTNANDGFAKAIEQYAL